MELLMDIISLLMATGRDVLPIIVLLAAFQFLVLRVPVPQWRKVVLGFVFVLVGLTLFMAGLDKALFPLGRLMAGQLCRAAAGSGSPSDLGWADYGWVYAFGAAIGFATTIAEPALIAVAFKANKASGGSVGAWGLRVAVALGVAAGIAVGTFRIVTGTPLYLYIIAGYMVVVAQTFFAPRAIIPLAYDSGGVTTSTVTVPLVAALGLGLSTTIPGRDPVLDGFGLIAFASLFPMISVMGYAQLARRLARRARTRAEHGADREG